MIVDTDLNYTTLLLLDKSLPKPKMYYGVLILRRNIFILWFYVAFYC